VPGTSEATGLTVSAPSGTGLQAPAAGRAQVVVLFLTVALMWGSTFLWVGIATKRTSPLVVVETRLVVGALVIALIVRAGADRATHRLADLRPWLWRGAALSFLMAVVPFLLLALALRHVSTGTAAILNATAPLWAAAYLLAIAGAGRHPETKLPRTGPAGLVIGLLGVAVCVGAAPSGTGGEALMLLCALTYSAGGVYAQRVFRDAPANAAALLATAIGAVVVLPLGVAGWAAHPPDAAALLAGAAAGAFSNGIAYLAYFALIRRIGATRSLSVTYVMPLVALALGVAFLGETIGAREVVGLALILLGVAAVHGQLGALRRRI
jgi:drug/metabolite transporter (DMT)-like permease